MRSSGRVGLCTDSSAQLPVHLVERLGIAVVPVTVTLDGVDHLEGLDLSSDDLAAAAGGTLGLTVGQPSSGQYALAFEHLLVAGASEIVSLHGPGVPGPATCSSARLAAHRLGVPVRLVDTGVGGFALGCCAWAVGEALAAGADVDDAIALVESLAPTIGTFVFDALQLPDAVVVVRRVHPGGGDGPAVAEVIAEVGSVVDAVNAVATAVLGWGDGLHVGIGHGSPRTEPVADALASALGEAAAVRELLRYRLGAAALAEAGSGPGVVSCSVFRPSSTT